jgi:hypothetical protein
MKKIAVLFVTLLTGLLILPPVASAQPYFGNASSDDACQTLKNLNPDNEGCGRSDKGVNDIITLALNLLTFIAAVIAVIMMFVSGFKYITAQGDANQISSAKKSLIYALAGLVVVASAQFLVKFVLARSINA